MWPAWPRTSPAEPDVRWCAGKRTFTSPGPWPFMSVSLSVPVCLNLCNGCNGRGRRGGRWWWVFPRRCVSPSRSVNLCNGCPSRSVGGNLCNETTGNLHRRKLLLMSRRSPRWPPRTSRNSGEQFPNKASISQCRGCSLSILMGLQIRQVSANAEAAASAFAWVAK